MSLSKSANAYTANAPHSHLVTELSFNNMMHTVQVNTSTLSMYHTHLSTSLTVLTSFNSPIVPLSSLLPAHHLSPLLPHFPPPFSLPLPSPPLPSPLPSPCTGVSNHPEWHCSGCQAQGPRCHWVSGQGRQ